MFHCEDTNMLDLQLLAGSRNTCPQKPVPIGHDLFGERRRGAGGRERKRKP